MDVGEFARGMVDHIKRYMAAEHIGHAPDYCAAEVALYARESRISGGDKP